MHGQHRGAQGSCSVRARGPERKDLAKLLNLLRMATTKASIHCPLLFISLCRPESHQLPAPTLQLRGWSGSLTAPSLSERSLHYSWEGAGRQRVSAFISWLFSNPSESPSQPSRFLGDTESPELKKLGTPPPSIQGLTTLNPCARSQRAAVFPTSRGRHSHCHLGTSWSCTVHRWGSCTRQPWSYRCTSSLQEDDAGLLKSQTQGAVSDSEAD